MARNRRRRNRLQGTGGFTYDPGKQTNIFGGGWADIHPVVTPQNAAASGGGGGGGPTAPIAPPQEQQSAWAYMQQLLDQVGLGSLGGVVQGLIASGMTDSNQLQLELQNTNEWKTRFAGNEALRQAGLGVLSVGEYLSVERTYAQVMRNFGLPEGFYDDPSDFAKYIGSSISPAELHQRVSAWADLAQREDPAIKAQLRAMGIGDGELTAYMMDPDRAAPLIQKTYQQALVGGAARRQGLDASSAGRLVGLGITEREAMQGFGIIGESLADAQRLGSIYGDSIGQSDLEAEVFENDGAAVKKRKRLASRERAAFQGSSGVGQGSLTRRDSGAY